jgi:hypothetical protein
MRVFGVAFRPMGFPQSVNLKEDETVVFSYIV